MNAFISRIIPVICFFFLGLIFKKLRLFNSETGHTLLKLIFYLFLPALSFLSVIDTEISKELLFLPVIPLFPVLFNFVLATVFLKIFPQPKKTAGVVYCAGMIMNTGFTLPFFGAAYGMEGFSRAIIFDLGNLIVIFTLIYFIAVKHGEKELVSKRMILKKFLFMPPLWAFLIGIVFVVSGFRLPLIARTFLEYASEPTIPIIMLALGFLFEPRLKNVPKALVVVGIRMIGGLIAGLIVSYFLPLDVMSKKIVIASCAAPIGYNTLIFSALENLDERFAATVVSVSILIGIVYIPVIFLFLR